MIRLSVCLIDKQKILVEIHCYLDKNVFINKAVSTINLPGYISNWAVEHWEDEFFIFKHGAPLIQFELPVVRKDARILSIKISSTVFIIQLHQISSPLDTFKVCFSMSKSYCSAIHGRWHDSLVYTEGFRVFWNRILVLVLLK